MDLTPRGPIAGATLCAPRGPPASIETCMRHLVAVLTLLLAACGAGESAGPGEPAPGGNPPAPAPLPPGPLPSIGGCQVFPGDNAWNRDVSADPVHPNSAALLTEMMPESSVHLDLVFMGVHGMDGKAGYTCPNLSEADTDRAMIEAGRRLVVLADHTKWGVIGIASIARLDQADVLVSDTGLDPVAQATIREAVGEVILVDVGEPAVPGIAVELDERPQRQVQAASRAH